MAGKYEWQIIEIRGNKSDDHKLVFAHNYKTVMLKELKRLRKRNPSRVYTYGRAIK